MEVTVINSRKRLCNMGGQHILRAHRHSKFIQRYTLMVYSHRDNYWISRWILTSCINHYLIWYSAFIRN